MASRVCLALAAVGWAPCAGSECQRGGHAATGSAASVFHHAPCQRSAGPLCRAGRPEWRTDRLSARLYRLVVLLQSGPASAPPRYHAYALDQRGHGDSDRPDCCYTVEDFAGDVAAFLDAVGAGRATLVGHSGSCLVARCVAEIHPERVARLVLIGAPESLGDNERSWSCRPRCAACGRRRTSWRSPFPGPGWSCTRRRATAPTGSAQRGLPPTSTPSYGRGVADPRLRTLCVADQPPHRRPGMREGAGAF
jgi:pimeloyl-ACP methyl ester carboxylesterase